MTDSNSTAALQEELHTGRLTQRAQRILDAARHTFQDPWTDRDMMHRLGYTDPNTVRPRITELTDLGYLITTGTTRDHVTGKTVRLSRAATPAEIAAARDRRTLATSSTQTELPL